MKRRGFLKFLPAAPAAAAIVVKEEPKPSTLDRFRRSVKRTLYKNEGLLAYETPDVYLNGRLLHEAQVADLPLFTKKGDIVLTEYRNGRWEKKVV